MKILSYQEALFNKYQSENIQKFRFVLSKQIQKQVFYSILVKNIKISIKLKALMNALKQMV